MLDPHTRRKRWLKGLVEPKLEYELQKIGSKYLKTFYPKVEFRVDLAGLNLSKAQSGMAKAVNKRRGHPDFDITECSGEYFGLLMELKVKGTSIRRKKDSTTFLKIGEKKSKKGNIVLRESFKRKKGMYYDQRIQEQGEQLERLRERGRVAGFAVGMESMLSAIDYYFEEPDKAIEWLEI